MPLPRPYPERLKRATFLFGKAAPYVPLTSAELDDRFQKAVVASVIVHLICIFGLTFKAANPALFQNMQALEVVLVNARSRTAPLHPEVLAQQNLDGGGDVAEERQAKSPLPASAQDSPLSAEAQQARLKAAETRAKRMLAQASADYALPQETRATPDDVRPPAATPAPVDLAAASLEMARLQARIDKDMDTYQKRPRRAFVGTRAQEFSYARYVEDWRIKVERIGNLNYPEAAKRSHIYGSLVLTVNIKADGTLEAVQIDKSSGSKVLDTAAVKIVEMAAPFSPFPAEMRSKIDILGITRAWQFTRSDQITSR